MNIKIKKVICSLGISLLILGAGQGYSRAGQEDPPDGQTFKKRMEKRIAEVHQELGLSPEQEKKLQDRRKAHREEMNSLYENMKAKKKELNAELQKSELNRERVKAIHSELKAFKAEKEDRRLEGMLEVREILTPDQFSKFMKIKEDRKMKRWGKDGDFRKEKFKRGSSE